MYYTWRPSSRCRWLFLLKALPCLEQIDKAAPARLLEYIPAEHLLVSYPVHSLGGRAKGMVAHYEAQLNCAADGQALARGALRVRQRARLPDQPYLKEYYR